ncbi:MAG: hypothetical protein OXP73_01850, partial [Chloroflexota bacterium]|nr:hypothetical protein [Chloroflexota bacterium]
MAVTVRQLAAALRLTTDLDTDPPEPQLSILNRLLGVGDAMVAQIAPTAPEAIKDEALVRFAAYLYDQPTAGRGDSYGNAWRNSGAASLVTRWVVRRASLQADVEAGTTPGSAGAGLTQQQVQALINASLANLQTGGLTQQQVQALIDAGMFQTAAQVQA